MGQISEGGGESSWSVQEYVLEPILRDEEFVLYRARHRNQADIPSVLVRTPISTRPAPESLKRIEHEYSFRAELDPVWAVRPLVISQHSGRTMLALEDPGGAPLDGLIQGPMEMAQFLRFAIGLATALSQLHKRQLIWDCFAPSPRTSVARASRVHRRIAPLYGSRADRPNEPFDRFAE